MSETVRKRQPKYGWWGQDTTKTGFTANGFAVGDRVRHIGTHDPGTIVRFKGWHAGGEALWGVDFDNGGKDYNQVSSTLEKI